MRLLVCEHTTGGGFIGKQVPPDLWCDGSALRQALTRDLLALRSCQVSALVEPRVEEDGIVCPAIRLGGAEALSSRLPELLSDFEAFWPLSAAGGPAVGHLTSIASDAGCRVIGSDRMAHELLSSTYRTSRHLNSAGVAVVPTCRLGAKLPASDVGWVVKPDAVGTGRTVRFFSTQHALEAWTRGQAQASPESGHDVVVQPHLAGSAVSLSLLCQSGEAWVLSCNSQVVSIDDGTFRIHGGMVGGAEGRRSVYQGIAEAVARSLPELWGYVEIDLIDREDDPFVLQVLPGLTLPYVGLGRALGFNPAGLVMELLKRRLGQMIRPIRVGVQPFKVGQTAMI